MNATMKLTMTAEQAKDASRKRGKPFCKVCFDAGKTEAEYTSHYLKSAPGPDGKLVCPTLLNQACLTCGEKGHTSSYCKKQQERTKQQEQDNQQDKRRSRRRAAHEFMDEAPPQPQPQSEVELQSKKVPSYNPRNNSYGALHSEEPEPQTQTQPEPQTQTQTQTKPLTMAERLKAKMQQAQAQQQAQAPPPPQKPKLPDLPSKSQFWWQDEDD